MTKKQHRKWKKAHKQHKLEDLSTDRPTWADYEKQEIEDKTWLAQFKAEIYQAISRRDR